MVMERIAYRYSTFVEDLKALAHRIDEPFDAIVAVARGGMTIAHLLSEYWDIRNLYTINTIGYEGAKKLPQTQLFNLPDLQECRRVLIVDDIADSGQTLEKVVDALQTHYPNLVFKTVTLFYKPQKSTFEPDWWLREADDRWIDFFWSEDLKR